MVESSDVANGSYGYQISLRWCKASYGSTPMTELCCDVKTDVPLYIQGNNNNKGRSPLLELVQPKFFNKRRENGDSTPDSLMDDPRSVAGKIGVYTGAFPDAVANIAAGTDMLALIVSQPLTEAPLVPVFKILEDFVEQALGWGKEAKVVVTALPGTPAIIALDGGGGEARSASNLHSLQEKDCSKKDPPEQGERSSSNNNNNNNNRVTYLTAATKTPARSSTLSTATRDSSPSSENSTDFIQEEPEVYCDGDNHDFGGTQGGAIVPTKKKRSLLGKIVGAVAGAVFGGDNKMEECLRNGAGWTKKENYKEYRNAMTFLQTLDGNAEATKSIVEKMPRFLQHGGGNAMLKLAFAGFLWSSTNSDRNDSRGKEALLVTIVSVLENCNFETAKPDFQELQRPFQVDWMKPNVALSMFFADMIKHFCVNGHRHGNRPQLWVNVLWLWTTCSLLKAPVEWDHWNMLRQILGSRFYQDSRQLLEKTFRRERFRTVALCLQDNIEGVRETQLVLSKDHSRAMEVEPAVGELLKKFARRIAASSATDEPAQKWNLLLQILQGCWFGSKKKTQNTCNNIIDYCMRESSFKKMRSFQRYPFIAEGIGYLDDGDHVKIIAKKKLLQTMRSDLEVPGGCLPAKYVHDLFSSPWSLIHLHERSVLGSFLGYVHGTLECRTVRLLDKLLLCDGIHAFSGELDATSRQKLRICLLGHKSQEMIEQAFQCAREYRDIYGNATGSESLSEFVSNEIGNALSKRTLMDHLTCIQAVILETDSSTCGVFAQCLSRALTRALIHECTSMRKAHLVFDAIATNTEHGKTRSMLFASRLLCKSFPSWQPRSIEDVTPDNLETLSGLLRGLQEAEAVQGFEKDLLHEVSALRHDIRQVFAAWVDDFRLDQLSSESLDKVWELSRRKIYPQINSLLNLSLPPGNEIEQKLRKIECLVQSIYRSLVAPDDWNVSLGELLRAYDCPIDQDRQFSDLFKTYSTFVNALPGDDFQCGLQDKVFSTRTLQLIYEDDISAKKFKDSCAEALNICDYFSTNPSILFRDKLALASPGGYSGVCELRDCVILAKLSIKNMFDHAAPLNEIREVVSTLDSSTLSPELEVATLRHCASLDLCDEDGERFLHCVLLCHVCEPILNFLAFCEQFKFAVVKGDRGFLAMKQLIDRVVTGKPIDDPKELCCRIQSILFKESTQASASASAQLESLVPLLVLFGRLANHQEIWKLADDRKWFGAEGMNSFMVELDHLTNVHLNSYQETVLEVMEPVIRVVSIIGGLATERKIASLFDDLLCNERLQEWLEQERYRDFEVVQQDLGEVRQWFCEGRDEIDDIYCVFQAIQSTGRYCLFNDGTTAEEAGSSLRLEYKRDTDAKMLTMNSSKTQAFVEQLGIIQHEDSLISESIDRFLEQYDLIRKAAAIVEELDSIGADSGRPTFSCSIGESHMEEAQRLLTESKHRLGQCEIWLQHTRKQYRLSLLFWPEELREMYALCQAQYIENNRDPDAVECLAVKLLRLFPLGIGRDSERKERLVNLLISNAETIYKSQGESWLLQVSRFIQDVYVGLGEPRQSENYDGCKEVVVHTVSCGSEYKDEVILNILQTVYKNRLPRDYEILDGMSTNFAERLPVFLERAKCFATGCFVILNIDKIRKEHVATIRSFLTCKESDKLRFHCIQREPALPQASPFFEHRGWTNDKRAQLSRMDNSIWRQLIISEDTFKHATLVVSSACCTGKTRFIRAQQQILQAVDDAAEIGVIALHEGSTADDLVRAVASKFSNKNSVQRSLHISLLAIPEEGSEARVAWLLEMNKFFFAFFVLRVLSPTAFHVENGNWEIFVEFPSDVLTLENWQEWLQKNVPVLELACEHQTPPAVFQIDEEARRVCTYLRAYEDGSINDRFEPATRKQIVFVIDRSESMEYDITETQTQLSAATDCALSIFDSHVQCDDVVGVVLFNHQTTDAVRFQRVDSEAHKADLRAQIDEVRHDIPRGGGTHMYSALSHVVGQVEIGPAIETWIVVLTDGDTDKADTDARLREQLQTSRGNLHLIIVGISLFPDYEEQMRLLANKYYRKNERRAKGFYVGADSTLDSLQRSFLLVSKEIPVSKTFDLLGEPTDEECRALIMEHCPFESAYQNMQLLSFWVRFLYRRVKVLDLNDTFNFNKTKDNIGSCLMKTMISEVARLVKDNQQMNCLEQHFAQLVYDFTDPESPEFRLLCTSPSQMDEALKQEYEDMELPGFHVPTEISLNCRKTLDKIISQAIGVPLEYTNDGEERLRCIDERGFVLTLDFTIKLLNMHERVATSVPCIIEGETGVSKTALTEMYSILRNSALSAHTYETTLASLVALEEWFQTQDYMTGSGGSPLERLVGALDAAQTVGQDSETEISILLHGRLVEAIGHRSKLFEDLPDEFTDKKTSTVSKMIEWFGASRLERTFFEINVHSSLREDDVVACFKPIRAVARKLLDLDALVVVFLDEINTSSTLGIFKGIVVDRSLQGERLEKNIVIVAACNPVRRNLVRQNVNQREVDLGRSWTSGHYQVEELPPSMACVKWNYGSLSNSQEKDFILRRIGTLTGTVVPLSLRIIMTEMISASQQAMRDFAVRDLERNLLRQNIFTDEEICVESAARSKSVVSLRDIQRVFALFEFFSRNFPVISDLPSSTKHRHAMLLSIAVVYYLRLDQESRFEFLSRLQELPGEPHQDHCLLDVLNATMQTVISSTSLRNGIAPTRGLKENLFATLVCTLSKTPLMIVGPPGCSKTLSVNAVGDNAGGEESPNSFYREFPRLSLYHYQCSKESTSTEIAAVFDKATRRQHLTDSKTTRCVVFMDEAGLPEENRESLKVLHYLLEGGGDVGFVAVSNHVVDAAKSNRTCMCFRSEPDDEEMLAMTLGVLIGYGKNRASLKIRHVDLGDGHLVESADFCQKLCCAYSALLHDIEEYPWLDTFFGLRDYIYFLKALRLRASFSGVKMLLTTRDILRSLERNFSGVPSKVWKRIALEIMGHIKEWKGDALPSFIESEFRSPAIVLGQALSQGNGANALQLADKRSRFKLIVDCSNDDSIMRLLSCAGLLDLSKNSLFKLSHLPEERERERLRLITGVKYAAMQGHTVLLSQTESVDESFYDLQNQNFREIETSNGVALYANIAVGGVSHRSPVDASFDCIVHVRESQLVDTPAPFLNRFEKYRLDLEDVLAAGWASLGGLAPCLQQSRQRAGQLLGLLGKKGLVGCESDGRSLDSVFVGLLPKWALCFSEQTEATHLFVDPNDETPLDCIMTFLKHVSSISERDIQILSILENTYECLPEAAADVLRKIVAGDDGLKIEQYQSILKSLLEGDKIDAELHAVQEIIVTVIQMVFTRFAVSTLLEIATPEAVYVQRHALPSWLVEEYFSQEHFSLKRLLRKVLERSGPQLLIVHTRTDASIHGIPSYGTETKLRDRTQRGDRDMMKALVCESADIVLVEHLGLLPSESSFRKKVIEWMNDSKKQVFLLFADMGKSKAVEKVNFVRMAVEQCSFGEKIFALVLHYPASNSLHFSSYPALFLGNWKHVFLDSIGETGPSLGLSESIQLACRGNLTNDRALKGQLCDSFSALMPTILPHVASCKNLFHQAQRSNQSSSDTGLFLTRRKFVDEIFATTLSNSATLKSVLCNKFSVYWLKQGLESTIKTSCLRLQRGTTQLSVTGSIHSTLLEVFDKFIIWCMKEMNTFRGLDVLQSGTKASVDLFGYILEELPILPFDELLLLQERGLTVPAMPPVLFGLQAKVILVKPFPFFYFVSSCLEEVLEFAAGEMEFEYDTFGLLEMSMKELSNPKSSNRETTVRAVVDKVLKSKPLFDQYIFQFIEWKASCSGNRFINGWLENSVLDLKAGYSIVAVHAVARCDEINLMKAASWSALAQQHPAATQITTTVDSSSWQHDLLLNTVHYLRGILLQEECDREIWRSAFASLLEQLRVIQAFSQHEMCLVRILFAINILQEASSEESLSGGAIKRLSACLQLAGDDLRLSASLPQLFELLQGNQRVEELLIQQFFSPLAMITMKDFQTDDFSFLVDAIDSGKMHHHSDESLISLLGRACTYFGSHKGESATVDTILGIPDAALQIINSSLAGVEDAEERAPGGLHHFVPSWLQTGVAGNNRKAGNHPFYSTYTNTLDGVLASVIFEVLLRNMLSKAEEECSTMSLLRLMGYLENCTQTAPWQGGCIVATMVADASTIVFVASLARDLATSPDDSALSGPYTEMCQDLLNAITEVSTARFADFLFGQVRRINGEACLINLLSANGPLCDLSWCRAIKDGMPMIVQGQENALREAEEKLAEVYEDEQQKARELKLCPHCGVPFGVAARFCGQFVCGQDAHNVIGREVYGCGRGFQVDTAPWYRVNEEVLAPLRATVEIERASLSTAHNGEISWNNMRDFQVPKLIILIESMPGASLVPAVSVLNSCKDEAKLELVRILMQGAELIQSLTLLADLVEFYVWLHSILGQMISREEAMSISMSDLMNRERLARRFDPIHTQHILSLWGRIVIATEGLLKELDYKAAWGCKLIAIPFKRIEDACLVSLLSDGVDPTDGYDYLFLIINQIIDRYNTFIRQMLEISKTEIPATQDDYSIHPKFIMSGSGGAAVVNHLAILSSFEIENLVAGSWSAHLGCFDTAKLHHSLKCASNLLRLPPSILNPMDCLRTQFVFRRESATDGAAKQIHKEVQKSPNGAFFARAQDVDLVRQVQDGLSTIGLWNGDSAIQCLLCTEFQKELDSHSKTCSMLGGIRNFLDAWSSEEREAPQFEYLGSALAILFYDNVGQSRSKVYLDKIGFPELRADKVDLLLKLSPEHVVELVRYLEFQLASEGYLYSSLPQCMAELLPKVVVDELVESLDVFAQENTLEKALACLKEFVRDVLVLYETLIVEAAIEGNQSLIDFLAENNFCGSEDPICARLPRSIGIQDYIALRQHLQQAELSLLHQLVASPNQTLDTGEHVGSTVFSNMTAGQCWLWQQDEEETIEPIKIQEKTRSQDYTGGLWFADCPVNDLDFTSQSPLRNADFAIGRSDNEFACRIQRWWRFCLLGCGTAKKLDGGSDDAYCDTLFDLLENDMDLDSEMELDEEPEEFCDYDEVEIPLCDASATSLKYRADEQNAPDARRDDVVESDSPMELDTTSRDNAHNSLQPWLESNGLPGQLAADFEGLGIRSADDLILTMNECEDILDDLNIPKLDRHKLKKAIRQLEDNGT